MFGRTSNLKRTLAFAAVLLSLSTLGQACGFYCYLGACGVRTDAAASGCSCCHHTKASAISAGSIEEHHEGHDSCPCSDECWCHEAPQPFDQVKSSGEPLELTDASLFSAFDAYLSDPVAFHVVAWNLGVPPDACHCSAVERCSKLCRFLI